MSSDDVIVISDDNDDERREHISFCIKQEPAEELLPETSDVVRNSQTAGNPGSQIDRPDVKRKRAKRFPTRQAEFDWAVPVITEALHTIVKGSTDNSFRREVMRLLDVDNSLDFAAQIKYGLWDVVETHVGGVTRPATLAEDRWGGRVSVRADLGVSTAAETHRGETCTAHSQQQASPAGKGEDVFSDWLKELGDS